MGAHEERPLRAHLSGLRDQYSRVLRGDHLPQPDDPRAPSGESPSGHQCQNVKSVPDVAKVCNFFEICSWCKRDDIGVFYVAYSVYKYINIMTDNKNIFSLHAP